MNTDLKVQRCRGCQTIMLMLNREAIRLYCDKCHERYDQGLMPFG